MIQTSENRKSSGDFSFIKTLGNLVVNDRFSRGYKEFIDKSINDKKNIDNENTFLWHSLSAIGDDIGNILYENVRHYIENVSDVDTCTVKSIASLAKELGIANVNLMDNLVAVPTDVLKLIDLFSINPSLLLNEDFINAPLVQELMLCCVTANPAKLSNSIMSTVNILNPPENNTELSDMLITYNINANKFYNQYLPAKFYDYLTSTISAEFLTTSALNKQNGYKKYYIFDAFNGPLSSMITGVLRDRNYGYEYLDPQCVDEISNYILLNNLSPYFNPSEILDNIDNGTDILDNYTDTERTLLSAVRESRETALLTLPGDSALFLTTRYDYYKARKILDLFVFINNLLGRGAKIHTAEWLPDTRYSTLSIEYKNDGVVYFEENKISKIDDKVVREAAKTLAEICHSIQIIRERVKTFTQQVYLRGSTLLMQFIVNEYLHYTLPYKYANLVDTGLISPIPKLENGWISSDNYDKVKVVEYWDLTEYYNLSTEHSEYAQNYSYVNYPFWLQPNDNVDSNSIPRGTINDFYMKMLAMNTVLSSKGNDTVSGFLSTIYSMGLLDSYVDNDVSVQVLPVEQTDLSNIHTNNAGVISALHDYQAFLTKTYSGLSTGTEPYYNWKNVTHPSWQVHPYLWNFVEKSELDNVIETTYNITANRIRAAAMKTNNVSACIGDASEILNLWRFKTEDFSGYLTRYEQGRQSFLKWNMQPSPTVNYDGIFYPDAIDDYMKALSTTETKTLWYNTETNEYRLSVVTGDDKHSGKWIQTTVKSAIFDVLSSIRDEISINKINWKETYYGKWYSHLQGGFETRAFMNRVAEQLSVYSTELSAIYSPYRHKGINPFEYHPLESTQDVFIPLVDKRPVDVYRYALDRYLNSYILIKRCHPETPEHIKKIIPGQLWIRFANHPIAFPAFGLPDEYLSCYSELSGIIQARKNAGIRPDVPQISPFKTNDCVVNYLSAEVKANPKTCWDFVYDFEITKDTNFVVIAVDSNHPKFENSRQLSSESDLLNAWQKAVLLVGEPYRTFETTPPSYTLVGDWDSALQPIDINGKRWNFAGLNGINSNNQSSIHALYLSYNDHTISIADSVIPDAPDITEVGSKSIYDFIDKKIEIPENWDFEWTATVNECTTEGNPEDKYMLVGKVPFFSGDVREDSTELNTQNWYGKSVAELYEPNMLKLWSDFQRLSAEIVDTWIREGGAGVGHTYPTEELYKTALANLVTSCKISADRYETMANMPGLVNYAGIQLSVDTNPVTLRKKEDWGYAWNSAERFGNSILRIFFYGKRTTTEAEQYIINSDASYIPLYPGTDGATRTWPVDNELLKEKVRTKVEDIISGDDIDVTPSYRLYWQTMGDDDKNAEEAAMVEDALVNSKQPIAAQNLGPEYDGLGDKIKPIIDSLSTNSNSEGEEVLVGSAAFTGSDALFRVIEEYDESKYYNVWLKPEPTKPRLTPGIETLDIDIPLKHLSVINGDENQKASQILGLSNWNFLVYNIDSPNVPIVAEPVLTTLARMTARPGYDWNLSTVFAFADNTSQSAQSFDLSGLIDYSVLHDIGLKDENGWIKDLSVVIIGTQISAIGEEAFANCNILSTIMIPESISAIGHDAFKNCSSLISVYVSENDTNRISSLFEDSGFNAAETLFIELPKPIPDSTATHYINIPTTYQQYFLEHLRVKDDLMGIDGNRDLFATGTDRDNTNTNYFMGIDGVTMDCNVPPLSTLSVKDWKVTLHFHRDPTYISNNFVVDKNQIVAFLYSKDFSQFEDYHYLQHHDVWPHATKLVSPGNKTINERVPINSGDPDSAYMTYLSAGNRYRPGAQNPFTTNLYPNRYTEGYHLSGVSAYTELPGSMLSGTHAFKINEESRSDKPNMFPDFLFYQTMASAFNLVVTETQDGNIFALSNTYIMEIVDPWRMVEAMGEFDILTYATHSDRVFMRAYEPYMSSQYSISKYDLDLVPYAKWYNAIEPYDLSDHLCVYSDLSTAWSSEKNLALSDINLVSIAKSRDQSRLGQANRQGYSFGGLNQSMIDNDSDLRQCNDLSSMAECLGHGVSFDRNLHTFVPAGVTFANTVGKRWVTADWNLLKNRCKLFINYEQTEEGFNLYFNYNNLFYNEYLYLDKNHTFHSCYKRSTFLSLKPGEAGQLEIIAQPRVYDAAGNVCGIRDVRLFTFAIKNTSDDKPKFDIIKTYELAKGGLPLLDYPADVAPPGGVYVHTVERETDIELVRQGAFDFVTSEDLSVFIPGEIIDNYGLKSISCDFLYEGFNPYLECDFDNCEGGVFESGGIGRIHFETLSRSSFTLAFRVLAGQYVSENELSFEIPIEIESAKGTGAHGEVVDLKKIPGGANIAFIGESTMNRALAKEPRGFVTNIRNNREHGGFVLTEENGSNSAKGKPIAIFTPTTKK